ncbi:MAG: M48 family metallopeptidase [Patescibacteria group bacterium]
MGTEYEIHESSRARHLRITVHPDSRVVVTKPVRISQKKVEEFIQARKVWIESARTKFLKQTGGTPPIPLSKPRKGSRAYKEAIAAARTLATERLRHFNAIYGFSYGTVSIRNQKTRWGSCSATGNLSFNYRIAFLPSALADYVIVHELCHTKEHNHSSSFWAEVARTVPNHLALRRKLRTRYSL